MQPSRRMHSSRSCKVDVPPRDLNPLSSRIPARPEQIHSYGTTNSLPDSQLPYTYVGNAEEKGREEEIKRRAFNQVTEAAGELMELGYEDIYTDTREAIQASAKGWASMEVLNVKHYNPCVCTATSISKSSML